MKKIKHTLLLFIAACSFTSCQYFASNALEPSGELKNVDTSKDSMAIEHLLGKEQEKASNTAKEIENNPSDYSPPVFYAMSAYLFNEGRKDTAMLWFYAGQVRARYDANRCTDRSAGSAVAVLNQQFGTPINQYGFQDIEKLEKVVKETIYWSLSTPHKYDHRWINLHGMEAFESNSREPSLPEEEWEEIRINTHEEYLEGFEQAIRQLKEKS